MGATQEGKGRPISQGVLAAWVGQDRLRPTHLRATLTRLLENERNEWEPLVLSPDTVQGEVSTRVVGEEVTWVGGACGRLGWGHETRFTAAALLLRLLHRVRIPPRYLHAVAAAALFLAGKLHEEDENLPATVEVVERGGMECSWRELLRMERVLLDKLAWHLHSCSPLDFLQVLHALAIVTAPKHHQLTRSGSPIRQLSDLTEQLWVVVCSGSSGQVRPSLLSLALLSLQLDASTPEPGVLLWLQALTQVSDEELASSRELVQEILGRDSSPPPRPPPPSRPNKRKVGQTQEAEDDMYVDIKKLYAYDKVMSSTCSSPIKHPADTPKELDETYIDIRRLYSSPMPVDSPLACSKLPSSTTTTTKKRKKKKTKPTFKAKTSVLKQALKIPCKISLISTKKVFEEACEEEEEEEEEMEVGEAGEGGQEWEGPIVEPVGIINSPIFSPTSPEFPDIRHHVVKKEDTCWHQHAQEVAEQVYRPLTYAQVLRLHLTPLTRALGV